MSRRSTAGTIVRPITSDDKLGRRRAPNKKYAKVRAVTKTGRHRGNTRPKLDTRGEIFRRIGRTTLAKMIRESYEKEETVTDLAASFEKAKLDEAKKVTVTEEEQTELAQQDYMILDLRDSDAFAEAHIKGALNFPLVQMRRDKFGPEIFAYKKKVGKFLVLYDETESKMGCEAATFMANKGFVTTHLLTGGLKRFAKKYGDMVIGENKYEGLPDSKLPSRIGSTAVSEMPSEAPTPKISPSKLSKRSFSRRSPKMGRLLE